MEKLTPEEKINIDFLKYQLKEKQEIIEGQFKEIERLKEQLKFSIHQSDYVQQLLKKENELDAYKLVNLSYIDKLKKISTIILETPSYEEVEKLNCETEEKLKNKIKISRDYFEKIQEWQMDNVKLARTTDIYQIAEEAIKILNRKT